MLVPVGCDPKWRSVEGPRGTMTDVVPKERRASDPEAEDGFSLGAGSFSQEPEVTEVGGFF